MIQTITRSKIISKNAKQNISRARQRSPDADVKKGQGRDNASPIESSDELSSWRPPSRTEPHKQAKRVDVLVDGLNAMTPPPSILSSTSEMSLLKGYLYHKPPLHVRRTLDEFFYSSLIGSQISQRDQSQIVFKFKEEKNKEPHPKHGSQLLVDASSPDRHEFRTLDQHEQQDIYGATGKEVKEYRNGNHPIVMVDQLWMWVIGTGTPLTSTSGFVILTLLDILITSFPQSCTDNQGTNGMTKREVQANKQSPSTVSTLDIIKQDLKRYDALSPISIESLACLIINSCTGFLDRYRDPPVFPILDIFSQTVNKAVSASPPPTRISYLTMHS
jgi:hypothetical protein